MAAFDHKLYLFLLNSVTVTVTRMDSISDSTRENHTPSSPHIFEQVNTHITGHISVLTTDRDADISPLFKAVNKDEPKKFSPVKI